MIVLQRHFLYTQFIPAWVFMPFTLPPPLKKNIVFLFLLFPCENTFVFIRNPISPTHWKVNLKRYNNKKNRSRSTDPHQTSSGKEGRVADPGEDSWIQFRPSRTKYRIRIQTKIIQPDTALEWNIDQEMIHKKVRIWIWIWVFCMVTDPGFGLKIPFLHQKISFNRRRYKKIKIS